MSSMDVMDGCSRWIDVFDGCIYVNVRGGSGVTSI